MTTQFTFNGQPERRAPHYPDGYKAARTGLLIDTMCLTCGALVADNNLHDAYHRKEDQ